MKKHAIKGSIVPINQKLNQKIESVFENKLREWKQKASSSKHKNFSVQSEGHSKESIHLFNFGKSR
jgi:hypothetical protein